MDFAPSGWTARWTTKGGVPIYSSSWSDAAYRDRGTGSRARRSKARPGASLTGTPGTGKSSIARALPAGHRPVEVGALALKLGVGRGRGRSIEVDLPALAARFRAHRHLFRHRLIVGHLAHLLPIRDAIVLRCHPVELGRRLARAHRGSARDRQANVEAEATDLVLLEALARHRRVWEVDT
ncbi:MAG: AAA family ATPase, partial [Thermoplasmata archaeon]